MAQENVSSLTPLAGAPPLEPMPRSVFDVFMASCLLLAGCDVERFELLPASGSPPVLTEPEAPTVLERQSLGAGGEPSGVALEPVPMSSAVSSDETAVSPPVLSPPLVSPAEPGCSKIDFLFVIDNSSSMRDEQENLATSFPGFIQVMQQVLDANDFHIMVVSTGGRRQDEDDPALDAEACSKVQGAGRRESLDGGDCGIAGGLPYMANGQPDLEGTFSCVAQVGTDGSAIEEPMDAVLAATSAALEAEGRCNAGFLRDDAVLVVTLITDEEDRRSTGDPADWQSALLALKGGDRDALVLLGLVGDNNVDGGLLGGPCSSADADGAPRLQELVDGLDGVLGSVCAADYAPFFLTAVGAIDSACSDFVPLR